MTRRYIISIFSGYQPPDSHVLADVNENALKGMWVCWCVPSRAVWPRDLLCLAHWCKRVGLVEAGWEALTHFQQHVLLHQLDNEAQQWGCVLFFFVACNSARTVPTDMFSTIFTGNSRHQHSLPMKLWDGLAWDYVEVPKEMNLLRTPDSSSSVTLRASTYPLS